MEQQRKQEILEKMQARWTNFILRFQQLVDDEKVTQELIDEFSMVKSLHDVLIREEYK